MAGDEDKGAAVARSRASRASLITSPDGSVMPSPITLIAARPVSVAATAATNQPTTASVVRRLLPPTRAAVARLLLIEDDPAISRLLLRALRDSGHTVAVAGTAMAGLRGALDDRPDLVVLDLGLPDLDGLELLRMLRAVSRVPVIISTARDDEAEIVRGLDAGADDYLVKPFTAGQLDARVRAVLRRGGDGAAGPPELREVAHALNHLADRSNLPGLSRPSSSFAWSAVGPDRAR
ncbi:Response regulatory domain-containing protein [Frankia sp. Hr75.2]|nr:Response regulatory domain-containing protein [Frankia sp. Hr75.2]SQD98538.1 hypothetical protein FMEAI12_4750012 [Parafrankia sp. Ea1.12]